MPKGIYKISKGKIEQLIEDDSVTVIDVRVALDSNSTTGINIKISN
jgi:hypothetical protein